MISMKGINETEKAERRKIKAGKRRGTPPAWLQGARMFQDGFLHSQAWTA
jgi:hypothetical protein